MITGTCHFVSRPSADSFYGDKKEVTEALAEARIFIGPPPIKDGERIVVIDEGRRYGVEDEQPFRQGDTLRTMTHRGRIVFDQTAPMGGRTAYCAKPWRSFWNGTAGAHFATIEEAQACFNKKPQPDHFDPHEVAALKSRFTK